ncbi:LPS-assembly protein LptD [Alkalimarinus sediminis]|uniref:LPS-assembly protein LptD n=1 Tax=Alkalimarinus sediminis TaxID=1632866 RepID=A0A9E8HJB4_9ALTE|nr:LPS-assembly protein LptD [Alkalimarinus sediminis]UZW74397.1 LPS-assembly protein LptD [Alkalimarinus sediminis]
MTKTVYQFAHLLVLPLTIASTQAWADESNSGEGRAKTAAEIDWRPKELMSEAERSKLSAICKGGYVVPSYLPDDSPPVSQDPSQNPMRVRADRASFDAEQNAYIEGGVEIYQAPFLLNGDTANLDQKANSVTVNGDIRLRSPEMLLTGNKVNYDIESGAFTIEESSYLAHKEGFRGQSASVKRPSENIVIIEDGTITRCDPHDKSWSVAASEITLDQAEGVGYAEHFRFRVQDVPIFYFPWVTFPINDDRKSGFLYPSIGSSNVGRGAAFTAPYYFNLAPNYDATLTPAYIHGRGLYTELEGRHLNTFGESRINLGYIHEDEEHIKDYPWRDGQRWGLSFENESTIADGWKSTIDYNVVSDNDYLEDLARSLSIENETHLDRVWKVNYIGDVWQFDGSVHGYQTVDSTVTEANKPYSRLPELNLIGSWNNEVFDWSVDSQYTYFFRDDELLTGNDKVQGNRLRIKPEVSMPMEQLWGYLTPSLKVDQTNYALEDNGLGDDDISRTVPFATLDTGLYFDRPFQFGTQDYNQTLEPRAFYVYSPEVKQDDIPDFDTSVKSFSYSQLFSDDRFVGGDRVGDNNRVTLGLTSRFTQLSSGIDSAVFSIGKIYYLEDQNVNLDGEGSHSESESPFAGEFILTPVQGLDLKVTGLWDDSESKTVEGNSNLSFHTQDYGYVLNLGHTYKDDDAPLEQANISTIVPVTKKISAFGRWLYDLNDKRTAGTLAGLEYRSCCWRAQVLSSSYLTDDSELSHTILFRIELKGLAGFGESGEEIDEQVPGYLGRERLYH